MLDMMCFSKYKILVVSKYVKNKNQFMTFKPHKQKKEKKSYHKLYNNKTNDKNMRSK